MKQVQPKEILIFESQGKCPYLDWLYDLKDAKARRGILARQKRVAMGFIVVSLPHYTISKWG